MDLAPISLAEREERKKEDEDEEKDGNRPGRANTGTAPRLAVVVRLTGRRGKHPHLCQCNAPVYTTYNIPVSFDLKPVVPVLNRLE